MPSPGEASPPLRCPPAMDAVPATVPSVTASPGNAGLLGPLSVLYAAFIARLLEVTAPIAGRAPTSGRGGRVLSGAGAVADGAGRRRREARGGQGAAARAQGPREGVCFLACSCAPSAADAPGTVLPLDTVTGIAAIITSLPVLLHWPRHCWGRGPI